MRFISTQAVTQQKKFPIKVDWKMQVLSKLNILGKIGEIMIKFSTFWWVLITWEKVFDTQQIDLNCKKT